MKRFLVVATTLAAVALCGLALAAQQPTAKAGAKQETRKETRSDPCEPESPKTKGMPAKKNADAKKAVGSKTRTPLQSWTAMATSCAMMALTQTSRRKLSSTPALPLT